jgi:hypothetical protein
MRCADGDEDTGFADLKAAEAVNDRDAMDGKFGVHLRGDAADFGEGHGLVGFVVEVEGGTAVRLVADAAVEGDDGSIFAGADMVNEGGSVNGLGDEAENVVARRSHRGRSTSADWGKKSDFIAGVQCRAPGGEFLIARSDQRGAEAGELGMARAVMGEELLDARTVGEVDGIFRAADDFFEAAEEENFNAHGLRNRRHRRIVARAVGGGQ